jgi:hypothetical protein
MRFQDGLFAVGALAGLVLAFSGLYGFSTDLVAGTTATGSTAGAHSVVESATDAGRYWGLMSAWLVQLIGGGVAFVFCARAWRERRALRAKRSAE